MSLHLICDLSPPIKILATPMPLRIKYVGQIARVKYGYLDALARLRFYAQRSRLSLKARGAETVGWGGYIPPII